MWVIDPSQNHPEDQGVAEILQDWSGESRLFRPALDGDGPGPGDGYDVDAIVLMGSAASVDDDLPWLGPLRAWLRPILDGDRQVLSSSVGGLVLMDVSADGTLLLASQTSSSPVLTLALRLEGPRPNEIRLEPGKILRFR